MQKAMPKKSRLALAPASRARTYMPWKIAKQNEKTPKKERMFTGDRQRVVVKGCQSVCRFNSSYRMIPAATEALSDAMFPLSGMRTM